MRYVRLALSTPMVPSLKELKDCVDKLQDLLHDPHPGLFTWQDAVYQNMKEISEYHNEIAQFKGNRPSSQ